MVWRAANSRPPSSDVTNVAPAKRVVVPLTTTSSRNARWLNENGDGNAVGSRLASARTAYSTPFASRLITGNDVMVLLTNWRFTVTSPPSAGMVPVPSAARPRATSTAVMTNAPATTSDTTNCPFALVTTL